MPAPVSSPPPNYALQASTLPIAIPSIVISMLPHYVASVTNASLLRAQRMNLYNRLLKL